MAGPLAKSFEHSSIETDEHHVVDSSGASSDYRAVMCVVYPRPRHLLDVTSLLTISRSGPASSPFNNSCDFLERAVLGASGFLGVAPKSRADSPTRLFTCQ